MMMMNYILARLMAVENGFAMEVCFVDIERFSERVCEARNLNQHFYLFAMIAATPTNAP